MIARARARSHAGIARYCYDRICSNVLRLVNRQGTRIAVFEVSLATSSTFGHHRTNWAA